MSLSIFPYHIPRCPPRPPFANNIFSVVNVKYGRGASSAALCWNSLLAPLFPPRSLCGARRDPAEPPPQPLLPRGCAAAAPLPAAAPPSPPAAAGQRPRAAHTALWQPASRRAETGRGRALPRGPGAAERRRLRLGRPAEGEAEEGKPDSTPPPPGLAGAPGDARPAQRLRAGGRNLSSGACLSVESSLRGEVTSRAFYLPPFVCGVGVLRRLFCLFFFSSLFFPPFGPFPLLCRDSVEWDLDEGSSLAEPLVCSQLWHMPCVYCLCMALVGPHAPSLLFIAGFAFCVCSE